MAVGLWAGAAAASTIIVEHTIDAVETWDSAGSPYIVTGNITVNASGTLSLDGPLDIRVRGNYGMTVYGLLQTTPGGGTVAFGLDPNSSASEWTGLACEGAGGIALTNFSIEDASAPIFHDGCGPFSASNGSIRRSSGTAVIVNITSNLTISGLSIDQAVFGLRLYRDDDARVTNVSVTNTTYGIEVMNSARITMADAVARASQFGLSLYHVTNGVIARLNLSGRTTLWCEACVDTTIEDADIAGYTPVYVFGVTSGVQFRRVNVTSNGSLGFDLAAADNVVIRDSRIQGASSHGVDAASTYGLRIFNLTVVGGIVGVDLFGGNAAWVEGLTVTGAWAGVYALDDSWGTLVQSTVLGSKFEAIALTGCNNWTIVGNNFIDAGAPPVSRSGVNNRWDDGARGNFWYPNNFTDANFDGVGDSPMPIANGTEADRFPLMLAIAAGPFEIHFALPGSAPEDTALAVPLYPAPALPHPSAVWTFGCAASAVALADASAALTFEDPGVCAVSLQLTNLAGQVATSNGSVVVLDITAPSVVLDLPSQVPAGAIAALGLSRTTDNDPSFPQGSAVEWNITDPAGTPNTVRILFANYSFAAVIPGTYLVEVAITDFAGNVGHASGTFVVTDDVAPAFGSLFSRALDEDVEGTLGPIDVFDDDPLFAAAPNITWTIDAPGDPIVLHGISPSTTIYTPGLLNVTITACDRSGNCASVVHVLDVADRTPPHGFPPHPIRVVAGGPVTFNASWVDDNDPRWPAGASYTWTFDASWAPFPLLGPSPTLTLPLPTQFNGTLDVQDAAGNRATFALTIVALDVTPPTLRASVPSDAQPLEPVPFSAASSADEAGAVVATWTFGDGTPDGAGLEVTHAYARAGDFEVRLEVRDLAGNANNTSFMIRVRDTLGPTIVLRSPTLSGGRLTCTVGETLELRAAASDASSQIIVEWSYSTGGGATGLNASFLCASPGVTQVRLNARDDGGNERNITFEIAVSAAEGSGGFAVIALGAGIGVAAAAAGLWYVRRRRDAPPPTAK